MIMLLLVMVFARLVQFVSSDEIYSFIHPEIDDVVYAGEPYEIRWDPGAPDRVDVWLWSGTSTSVFQDDFIAVGTENSGSYRWLPAKTLARTDVDHYNLNMCGWNSAVCPPYEYKVFVSLRNELPPSSSLSSLEKKSTSPPVSPTLLSTTTPTITPTSPTVLRPFSTTTSPKGLSSDAKIAIAVVVTVISTALLMMGFGVWVWHRKRKGQDFVPSVQG
ncbi:hypothetical protein PMIN03_001416 [Paraphaeosphaeria minitans]